MPKGPRRVRIRFDARTLTHYGGIYLLQRFFTRLRLQRSLTKAVRFRQRNTRYSIGEMVLALLYPMLLGLERLESTQLLTRNGVFQSLSGLPVYPNATTLRRFLLRLGQHALPKLRRLHDGFRARVVAVEQRRRFIFDVDSTVLVVYGHQEQARRGYNPTKRGRLSYHPLVCFQGQSRDYWAGELRPGDAHTAQGAVDLLAACFARLPPDAQRVDVRGDKGFYDGKIVAALEDRRSGFVMSPASPSRSNANWRGCTIPRTAAGWRRRSSGTNPIAGRGPIGSWSSGAPWRRTRAPSSRCLRSSGTPIKSSSQTWIWSRSTSGGSTTIGRRSN